MVHTPVNDTNILMQEVTMKYNVSHKDIKLRGCIFGKKGFSENRKGMRKGNEQLKGPKFNRCVFVRVCVHVYIYIHMKLPKTKEN